MPAAAVPRAARLAAAITVALVAMVSTLGMSTAMADTSTSAKTSVTASVPGSSYNDPIQYLAPSTSAKSIKPQVTGNGSSISATHSVTICPPSCGSLVQSFNTTYDRSIGIITSCFQDMNGSAYAAWDGDSPFDANKMTLNNNVWV